MKSIVRNVSASTALARSALLGTILAAALTACTDVTDPSNLSATGTYSLQSVNGYQLPYTFGQAGSTVSIQGDTYTLYNDNTYTEITQQTVSNGFQSYNTTQSESGNWYQNNNAITFTPRQSTRNAFASYTAALGTSGAFGTSTSLTIAVNGTVSVYTRN